MTLKRVFSPLIDSETESIISYDYLELPSTDITYTFNELCEMVSVADNITVLGLNSIKRLLLGLYELQKDCDILPEISLYTMFKGIDAPVLFKKYREFSF